MSKIRNHLNQFSSLIVLALAIPFLASCEDAEIEVKPPVVRPVLSMVIGDTEKIRTDIYHGRAEAVQEINLGFEVSGKVLELHVKVGDQVEEGQVLATLDPAPFQAEIDRVLGERAAFEAQLTNAETELKRREVLLKKDFVSKARVDNQVMLVRAAKAKIKAVDGALEGLNVRMNYTVLKAPYSGTVSDRFIEKFQNVIAKQPIVRVLDTSQIEMEVSVPEDLIILADYVKSIEVEYNSLPGMKIPAEIKEISNEASLTTRTYPVTLVMKQPDGAKIAPGMAGSAKAIVELPDDWTKAGMDIPVSAIVSPATDTDKKSYAWIVDEDSMTVKKTEVKILGLGKVGYLVDGLKTGDRIVKNGGSYLKDGQAVRLKQ